VLGSCGVGFTKFRVMLLCTRALPSSVVSVVLVLASVVALVFVALAVSVSKSVLLVVLDVFVSVISFSGLL
jgi:hypothetical protein